VGESARVPADPRRDTQDARAAALFDIVKFDEQSQKPKRWFGAQVSVRPSLGRELGAAGATKTH
jgi:hypothetical protein